MQHGAYLRIGRRSTGGAKISTSTRFWRNVEKTEGCWIWRGCISRRQTDKYGHYGSFRYKGRRLGAHRVAYLLANGEIPNGFCVCHSCDNPQCVRPDHLFLGTHKDNIADAQRKGRFRKASARTLERQQIAAVARQRGLPQGWHRRQLTLEQAREAALIHASGESLSEFARSIGKSPHTVLRIVQRNRYAGVTLSPPGGA